MFSNYNIFYKENTLEKLPFLLKTKKDFCDFPYLNNKYFNSENSKFVTRNEIISDFEKQGIFFVDLGTLFMQELNKDLGDFFNIKDAINYLYKNYSSAYCVNCNKEASKFNEDILKSLILNFKSTSDFLVLITYKINCKNIDDLINEGTTKVILNDVNGNNALLELNSNRINNDILKNFVYAINYSFNVKDDFKNDDAIKKKIQKATSLINTLKDKEIKIFFLHDDKLHEALAFNNSELMCPCCFKKFVSFNDSLKESDYIFNGILYSSFFNLEISKLSSLLDKSISDAINSKIFDAINVRIKSLVSVRLKSKTLMTKVNELSFFDYFKVILSVILETMPKNVTLLIKDIFDYLSKNEVEEALEILNKNFENYFLLSKNDILNNTFAPFYDFKKLSFFNINESYQAKKIKYLGEVNNLYEKIIILFLNSFDVKASTLAKKDFSISKLRSFIEAKEEGENVSGEAFTKYTILNFNLYELANLNFYSLLKVFSSFKDIANIINGLCENKLGDKYLLSSVKESVIVL